jgi:hypothetical protein
MAIRELTAPASSRTRRAKYPFTPTEVKEAVKLLKAGKTPGVGPYEGETALKEARSASQSLVRHVKAVEPDMDVGTKAWEDAESGDAYAILKLRS